MIMEGKKILITGASGFLGSHVSKALVEKNNLIVLGRKKPEIECEFIESDLSKNFDISRLPKDVNVVVHLAAELDVNKLSAKDVFNINSGSTLLLLEYARAVNAEKFVYISSGGVYGYKEEPCDENSEINLANLDYYHYTKAISDFLVQQYSKFFTTIIVRPFYVYGKGQEENRLFNRLIKNIKSGEPITLFNSGKNPRISLIHIDDFLKNFLKALEAKESVTINITGDENKSIKEIAESMSIILKKKANYIYKEDKNIKNRLADTRKMKKLLNLEPDIKFDVWLKEYLTSLADVSTK